MGKGGGGGAPTQQTVTQTNVPEYLKPYLESLTKRAEAESYRQYTPYGGERIAGFSPTQTGIQQEVLGLDTPQQIAQATQGAGAAQAMGLGAAAQGLQKALAYQPGQFDSGYFSASYAPSAFGMERVQAPNLNFFQMQQPGNVQGAQLQNFAMQGATDQANYLANLERLQMAAPQQVNAPSLKQFGMAGARMDPTFLGQLEKYQMGTPQQVAAERAGAREFGGAEAERYMSPFQRQVSDVAARELQRRADITKSEGAMRSIGRGTFGGSRQALLQAEQDRATQQAIGDIYTRGQQAAFENAQQQFERDQARGMAAQQLNVQSGLQAALANQQAGLTAGQANLNALLGVQQLGTQSTLQAQLANLSNEQQANVQNLAAQLQTQGLSADQALRSALANQQAGLTVGQQNLSAAMARQQLGTQADMQTRLANLSNAQQANVQNLAAQLQTQGLSADQALRAALANQQTGLATGQQNLAALLQTQGLGAQQALEAQRLNQAMGLETQRAAEQSAQFGATFSEASAARAADMAMREQQAREQAAQFGAGLGQQVGLGALQAGTAASQLLGGLGETQQATDLSRLTAQQAVAAQEQAQRQQAMDLAYADFLRQRDYPLEQLGFFSNIIRGLPQQMGSSQITYQAAPSAASQVAGLGLAGLGLYNLLGK